MPIELTVESELAIGVSLDSKFGINIGCDSAITEIIALNSRIDLEDRNIP